MTEKGAARLGAANAPRLFRRRLIPNEVIELNGDVILHADDEIIITKWTALKPRQDFCRGCSCYFLKEGYKVSRLFGEDNKPLHYYCDIIKYDFTPEGDGRVFTDLLFDVVVTESGMVEVLDLEEGASALKSGLISAGDLCFALETLDRLLKIIYQGSFGELTRYIDGIWET